MADLTELQSTLPVKIAGASSTGLETNFVNSNSTGQIFTIYPDRIVTGSITSTQSVTIDVSDGYNAVGVNISGTWTGTVFYEASVDGVTFTGTTALLVSSGTPISSSAANGSVQINSAGFSQVRVRGNTVNSGTAVIYMRASRAVSSLMLDNPLPAGTNTIGNVGQSGTWNISQIVQPLPGGTNVIGVTGVAQASTTAGEFGPLVQGAVTTAAPTYTTGQTDPLSLTTAGALRVDGSASTQPISGTVTANAGTGNFTVVQPTGTNLHVVVDSLPADADALTQGSTTSGQLGGLNMAAVTTASPSYTTAQTSPLSLTTAGALRVDGSATTQPVSGTVAATQSGTWTVQPGNTANTTPWLSTINQGGNSANVTANNDLQVTDGLKSGGVYGALTLTTANTTYEAKVGGSALTNRKMLTIQSVDADMYWGYDSSVTTSTGTLITNGSFIAFQIKPGSTFAVFLVCASSTKHARITESP